jgi:hypothetical protein
MCDHDQFGILSKIQLPHTQYKTGHGLQYMFRVIFVYTVAATISREIDGD